MRRSCAIALVAAALGGPASAGAVPLQVGGVAYFVSRSFSDFPGDPVVLHQFVLSASCVSPDGDAAGIPECRETPVFDHTATLGVAMLPDGSQLDLRNLPGTNQFFELIDFDPALPLDSLELTFTNGADVTVAQTPDLFNFIDIPLIVATINGTDSVTPTFSWMLPALPGDPIDTIHLSVQDLLTSEVPVSVDLSPAEMSFQVPGSAGLIPGRSYALSLIVADTRDAAAIAPLATNVRAWSNYSTLFGIPLPEPSGLLLGALVLGALAARRRSTRALQGFDRNLPTWTRRSTKS